MTQLDKVRGMMGLCVRARQATFGEDGCLKTVRSGGCGILLLDEGASAATKEKYLQTCARHQVPCVVLPEGLLEQATGRPGMAMAVARGSLAGQLVLLTGAGSKDKENTDGSAAAVQNSGGATVECRN